MNLDMVPTLNSVLSVVILILGLMTYKKRRDTLTLCISIAFMFFGISHFLTVLGFSKTLESALIVIRLIGYLTVIFGLFRAASRN